MIFMITFSFLNQTQWCDPHWNRLSETIPVSGNIIGFGWEIRKLTFWKLSILDIICCPDVFTLYWNLSIVFCCQSYLICCFRIFSLIENSAQEQVHGNQDKLNPEQTMMEIGMASTFTSVLQQCSIPIYMVGVVAYNSHKLCFNYA